MHCNLKHLSIVCQEEAHIRHSFTPPYTPLLIMYNIMRIFHNLYANVKSNTFINPLAKLCFIDTAFQHGIERLR